MPGPKGRRALVWLASAGILIAVLYFGIPRLAGLNDTWRRIENGSPAWLGIAVALEAVSYVGYAWTVASFSSAAGIVLGLRRSTEITLAATAATRLLAAGGAGGVALTTWALARAGHGAAGAARQVSAHVVTTYGAFMVIVISVGTGMALAGEPPALTALPAVIALLLTIVFLVAIQAPDAIARRLDPGSGWRHRVLSLPRALSDGTQFSIELLRRREPGLLGVAMWWIFDIATLWACFEAFGGHPPIAELTMAYALGMLGNLLPLPGGVGGVEGGMVGAFAAFDVDASTALVAVLAYRAISVWLPALPGVVALATLRRGDERDLLSDDEDDEDA